MTLPTSSIWCSAKPSARRLSTPSGDGASSRSETRSVTTRLTSSGIDQSRLRSPASTWATRQPALAPTRAQASVELTSPTTTTQSGRSDGDVLLEGHHDLAGLLGMAAGTDVEVDVGGPEAEVVEEHVAHGGVVVLAGVDQFGLVTGRLQRIEHRFDLHEVGSRSGDTSNLHRNTPFGPRGPPARPRLGIDIDE